MAKVFCCGGLSGRLGMLRAVVPIAELSTVLSKEAEYLRKSFPKMKPTDPHSTIIEVVRDEQGLWTAGFYRAVKGPLAFEDQLRAF